MPTHRTSTDPMYHPPGTIRIATPGSIPRPPAPPPLGVWRHPWREMAATTDVLGSVLPPR